MLSFILFFPKPGNTSQFCCLDSQHLFLFLWKFITVQQVLCSTEDEQISSSRSVPVVRKFDAVDSTFLILTVMAPLCYCNIVLYSNCCQTCYSQTETSSAFICHKHARVPVADTRNVCDDQSQNFDCNIYDNIQQFNLS